MEYVKIIQSYAFQGCTSLQKVILTDYNVLPTEQYTTFSDCFEGCSSLTELDILGVLSSILDLDGMFGTTLNHMVKIVVSSGSYNTYIYAGFNNAQYYNFQRN